MSGDSIRIDFTGTEEPKGNVVDPGVYDAEVEDVELLMGKDSGEPYLMWKFRIVDGDFEGKTLKHVTSLSAKSKPYTRLTLRTIMGDRAIDGEYEFDPEDAMDRPVTIQVKSKPWTDKDGVEREGSEVARVLAPRTDESASHTSTTSSHSSHSTSSRQPDTSKRGGLLGSRAK